MSFCLVLLAAGDSKRFGSKIPKPFIKIGEKTLLEYSLIKFGKVKQELGKYGCKKLVCFFS